MPRSTTTVEPGLRPTRFSKVSSISPTVVRSWRLPSKISCALGKPSRSSTSPTSTCFASPRLSREYPRFACGLLEASPSK